jgi:hypothetical protein
VLPDYTNGSGFYNPGQVYTGVNSRIQLPQGQPYQIAGSQDQDSAYYAKLAQLGLGGVGSRAQSAQRLLGQFQRGYGAARLNSNFDLYFPEYLDQARIGDIINRQSYEQQGLNPTQFQGRYRWGMRPGG